MDKALYFPYIDVPNVQWTSKILLYWDTLFSIVPMEYWDNPEKHSDFMRTLVQEGLVQQISPAQYLYEIPDFENQFIQYVTLKHLRNNLSQSSDYSLIHIEKLGQLPGFLTRSNLAFRKDHSWYFVRSDVANEFMGYLAVVLSKHTDIAAAPVTFQTTNQLIFTKRSPVHHTSFNSRVNALRDFSIHKILPTPRKRLQLGELINFKAKYGHLLPRYRNYVEREIINISQIQDKEEQKEALSLFIEGAKIQSEELTDAMKTNWGNITFGTLLPIVGAGLSALAIDGPLAIAGVATALTNAIYNAVSGISPNRRAPISSPLAYVAHAHRKFV